jgi:hypothetical protein
VRHEQAPAPGSLASASASATIGSSSTTASPSSRPPLVINEALKALRVILIAEQIKGRVGK